MSYYIIKKADGDFEVCDQKGETIETWAKRPSENEIIEVVQQPSKVAGGFLYYRDLTIPDETVPWES